MTTIKHRSNFVAPTQTLNLHWRGYDSLPDEIRASVLADTVSIKSNIAAEANTIWERGRLLHRVSQQLLPEQFVEWAYDEFRISRSNAYETMNVYACFPDGLGPFAVLAQTAIRELSRPTTPAGSYDRVRALLDAGQQPSIEEVKTAIQQARDEEEGYRSFQDDGDQEPAPPRRHEAATETEDSDGYDWSVPLPDEEIEPDESNDEYLEHLQDLIATLQQKYTILLNTVRRAIERRNSEFDPVELTDADLEKIAHLL